METVHFKLGENLGNILLEIAQDNIVNGEPERAFETYTKSFHGMDKSYALQILKNKFVVETCEDGVNINLTDDKEAIENNASNIYDWEHIIRHKYDDLGQILKAIYNVRKEFDKHCIWASINDVNLTEVVERYFGENCAEEGVGVHNLAAHWIAWGHLGKGLGNGANIWQGLVGDVESDIAEHYEYTLYYIVKYVELIKHLHKDFVKFEKIYNWLYTYQFIPRISFIENRMENILEELCKFGDQTKGYYNPMCDTELYNYKAELLNDIHKSSWGKEYIENGILNKNIMDGYDAGWLSPDGEFYGGIGETSAMIHMNIAEQMFNASTSKYAIKMKEDGVSVWGGFNAPEYWLEKHGWIKIHHEDCYGSFIGRRDEAPTPDYPYAYNPTDIQVKMICDYADKFYGGKFYTEANALGRLTHTKPFSTYKVRQMDEFKLHETFGR